MRRGFALVGVLTVVVAAVSVAAAVPSAAIDERPRNELLTRIASLYDDAELAQARVVRAQSATEQHRRQALALRRRVAERAVAAYVRGGYGPVAPDAYNDIVAARQASLVGELTAARAAAVAAAEDVETFARASAGPTRELSALHAELDRVDAELAAQRTAEERAADDARRRALATALGAPSATPRSRRAMLRQTEVLARYAFGPLAPGTVPAGLRPEGDVTTHLASWYGPGFNGRQTATGAIYDQEGWTAASPTLPLGTILLVSRGDRRALLLVNDRGPYIPPRTLDLSHAAAVHLGVGVDEVTAQIVVPA